MVLGVAGWLALLPAVAKQDVPSGPNSLLKGKILGADGKTAIEGATVMLYHLSSEQAVSSEPTSGNGEFEITALPYGYFDLAVATSDGLYVANQVINVPPAGKSVVALTLRRFAATTPERDRRPFPGTDESPVGLALLSEKLVGAAFWRSPKGIGLIGGAGGGLLLLLAGGGDDPVSPSSPQP